MSKRPTAAATRRLRDRSARAARRPRTPARPRAGGRAAGARLRKGSSRALRPAPPRSRATTCCGPDSRGSRSGGSKLGRKRGSPGAKLRVQEVGGVHRGRRVGLLPAAVRQAAFASALRRPRAGEPEVERDQRAARVRRLERSRAAASVPAASRQARCRPAPPASRSARRWPPPASSAWPRRALGATERAGLRVGATPRSRPGADGRSRGLGVRPGHGPGSRGPRPRRRRRRPPRRA